MPGVLPEAGLDVATVFVLAAPLAGVLNTLALPGLFPVVFEPWGLTLLLAVALPLLVETLTVWETLPLVATPETLPGFLAGTLLVETDLTDLPELLAEAAAVLTGALPLTNDSLLFARGAKPLRGALLGF